MKRSLFALAALALQLLCASCGGSYGRGVPTALEPHLKAAFEASPRGAELSALLRETPRAERAAMAYLLCWMPAGDRDTMSTALLRENVEYACRARTRFAWTKGLPDSIFLNEVLPYASIDEVRDAWRADFYARFAPRVEGCRDMRAAIDTVNRIVAEVTGVSYNTLREKTNQSPAESMRQGMASCTGLAVLLVDALRAVGIPARFAGTPAWHDNRGNHSWTEVWIDGEWYFTEYTPGPALNRTWFLADAGQATCGDPQHAIYATSFRPTGAHFPMVWSEESREVAGIEVTERYRAIHTARSDELRRSEHHTTLAVRMFRSRCNATESGDRVEVNVDLFCGAEQQGGGRTAGPLRDMNDALTFTVEKNRTYRLLYTDARDKAVELEVALGSEPLVVDAYME